MQVCSLGAVMRSLISALSRVLEMSLTECDVSFLCLETGLANSHVLDRRLASTLQLPQSPRLHVWSWNEGLTTGLSSSARGGGRGFFRRRVFAVERYRCINLLKSVVPDVPRVYRLVSRFVLGFQNQFTENGGRVLLQIVGVAGHESSRVLWMDRLLF
jgi:hypothetical protein